MKPLGSDMAEYLVAQLEAFEPRSALEPFLPRIEAIASDLRSKSKKLPAAISAPSHCATRKHDPAAGRKQSRNASSPVGKDIMDQVFTNEDIVASILQFDGALAMYHKLYSFIVGTEKPYPYVPPGSDPFLEQMLATGRYGTKGAAFVNKLFSSLVLGESGLAKWKVIKKANLEKEVKVAVHMKDDHSKPWLYRLCAMTIANDDVGLKDAFRDIEDESRGFGAATREVSEDTNHEDFCMGGLLEKCPFPFIETEFVREDPSYPVMVTIAYNAALYGATSSLLFLLQRDYNSQLGALVLDDKGLRLIHCLIERAYRGPLCENLLIGIWAILGGADCSPDILHERRFGTIGNCLHIAAAKGDLRLVRVLVEGGFDPSRPCEHGALRDERGGGSKELPLPEHWALERGHLDVAQYLRLQREHTRPDLRKQMHENVFSGKLETFFPQRDRQYGFISPDPRQQGLGHDGVFVHISTLRGCVKTSEEASNFPSPGQKLCFTVERDFRGRIKATKVFSGDDFSHLKLSLPDYEAEDAWNKYSMYGDEGFYGYPGY